MSRFLSFQQENDLRSSDKIWFTIAKEFYMIEERMPEIKDVFTPVNLSSGLCNNLIRNEVFAKERNLSSCSNDSTTFNEETNLEFLIQANDQTKQNFLQKIISTGGESPMSDLQSEKVESILELIQELTEAEKNLLYVKLPSQETNQVVSISTSKWEQTQAFQWIRKNLEECDKSMNLPKHEVYDDYRMYCEAKENKRCLSAPDFGKIVKCMFPNVKARRLGTRGNSKYCYNGLRRIVKSEVRDSQSMTRSETVCEQEESLEQAFTASCKVVCDWANKLLGRCFNTLIELAKFLVVGSYVSTKSMAAFIVMSTSEICVEKMLKRFDINGLSNLKSHVTKGSSNSLSNSLNRIASITVVNSICTPSKTVMGVANTKAKATSSMMFNSSAISSKIPNHMDNNNTISIDRNQKNPHEKSAQPRKREDYNGNKISDEMKVGVYTIDLNDPVILDNNVNSTNVCDNFIARSISVKEEPVDSLKFFHSFNTSSSSDRITTSPLSKVEKRKISTPKFIDETHLQLQIATTENSGTLNKTPRKVGRPRKTEPSSPYSPRSTQYAKCQPLIENQQTTNSLFAAQGHHSGFGNWYDSFPPHQQVHHHQQSYDTELKNIFCPPHTPPMNCVLNTNNRCQSVPIPYNQHSISTFQPLTPQSNITNYNVEASETAPTFNAKRNLNSMFNEPQSTQQKHQQHHLPSYSNSPTNIDCNNTKVDHIVPNSIHATNTSKQAPENPMRHIVGNELHELCFNLNDLSTPEEMGELIGTGGVEKLDGDELIKCLEKTNNWDEDWSTSTVPLMNIPS